MNNLFRHIEFLLLHHDCVIVPGLGAFIATSRQARIDREARRIDPPCRYVMFNQAITLDDGLLANSYARSLSLTFEEARQVIAKDVASLMELLREQRSVLLKQIGTLSLGEENRLNFRPETEPESVYESMGYTSLNLSSLQNTANKPQIAADDAVPPREVPSMLRRPKRLIKFTAVFMLFMAVIATVVLYPTPHDSREHRASVMPVEALLPSSISTVSSEEKEPTTSVMTETVAPDAVNEVLQVLPTHFLIVATFHSDKEAARFVELYSSEEFPLETVSSKRLTRVAVASSDNKEQLIKKLNSADIQQRFPNSWIWSDQ